jgi:hypothetical protein
MATTEAEQQKDRFWKLGTDGQRLLFVTFLGTLVANVVTAVILGVSLLAFHLYRLEERYKNPPIRDWRFYLILVVGGGVLGFMGLLADRFKWISRVFVFFAGAAIYLVLLFGLFALIGYLDGLK